MHQVMQRKTYSVQSNTLNLKALQIAWEDGSRRSIESWNTAKLNLMIMATTNNKQNDSMLTAAALSSWVKTYA
jgi:hypothetical protein